jgi:hypothetical protein
LHINLASYLTVSSKQTNPVTRSSQQIGLAGD